ncbi:MAG: polymer-forming cytoskeletal protein [Deltaproteobacteria bacterium]|nr:MAG: polymer-forming cytoskeletal protein [Deltaproteobacteria bacterium]
MATTSSSGFARTSGASGTGTVLGAELTVEGEISGNEPLQVEGTVKGRIAVTDTVTIGAGAVVEADLEVREAKVAGALTGNVSASERVEVGTEGRLIGDVRSPRLLIAEGASFKGHVDMDV